MEELITVIILTKNEEKNIEAAIQSAKPIASRIIIIDCGSEDRTVALAKKLGAEVFFHEWPGHAKQFNWALDNCDIRTPWVMRLDADERITNELSEEMREILPNTLADGFDVRCRVYFMGKWIKHGGTYNHYYRRIFRYGKGRCEEKLIDEGILVDGLVKKLSGDLVHYDYKSLDVWLRKHIWYSNLELLMYETQNNMTGGYENQKKKRKLYYKLPAFFRVKLYYYYRYYYLMGFLDGREGKIFAFLQAYWYRFIIDSKIFEKEKNQLK